MTLLQRIRARCRESRGQALILTTVSMGGMLGIGAMAIDAANWYQRHHQEQVAADSASLAAANCLANGAAGKTCTSTTDTTDAAQVATTIAARNGLTIPTSDVTFSGTKVTVQVPGTAPSFFASVFGIHGATSSANAAASFTTPQAEYGQTTTNGTVTNVDTTATTITNVSTTPVSGSPLAIFAMDTTCGHDAAALTAGSETINGGIFSNSSVYLDPGGSSYESINYGTGSGCTYTTEGGGGTYKDGDPAKAASDLASMPIPYGTSADPLPSCTYTWSGSGSPPVGSASGSTWDIPDPSSETTPEVYCYSGGAILLTGSAYDDDTYECGSLSVQGGGVTLEAEDYSKGQHLLIYATGGGTYESPSGGSPSASNTTVYDTNGAGTLEGDVDAPNGTIDINSGSNGFTGLLEAQDVWFGGGSNTITGDGPTTYGDTTSTATTTSTETTTNYTTTTGTTTVVTGTSPGTDDLSG